MTQNNATAISVYLGEGENGIQRKQALEELAYINDRVWGGAPSIGKLISEMADDRIKLKEKLPIIEIVDVDVVRQTDLKVPHMGGTTIDIGYSLKTTLKYNDKTACVFSENFLVYREQSERWCKNTCEEKKGVLLEKQSATPGEIMRLLSPYGIDAISSLGIPTPPKKRYSTPKERERFRLETGRAEMYLENDVYANWAREYNKWIIDNQELAQDYGCCLQDENWIPVK